jgi:hypothetical protein
MGEIRNVYKDLVGKPKERRLGRRLGSRWKDNVKWVLKKYG